MEIIETNIPDVKLLKPKIFGDERGFFMETFRDNWFKENVANVDFVQENHSSSSYATLRGMHHQRLQTQGKLVRVTEGEVFDVAVDIRPGSTTYGEWAGCTLSAKNKLQMWIPPGFAHGFLVLSDMAEFVYKCTDYYHPTSELALKWDDPNINIDWPLQNLDIPLILSPKDRAGISFKELPEALKS